MHHIIGKETCDKCEDMGMSLPVQYEALVSDDENHIKWYACGHVYIVKEDLVEVIFDYSK